MSHVLTDLIEEYGWTSIGEIPSDTRASAFADDLRRGEVEAVTVANPVGHPPAEVPFASVQRFRWVCQEAGIYHISAGDFACIACISVGMNNVLPIVRAMRVLRGRYFMSYSKLQPQSFVHWYPSPREYVCSRQSEDNALPELWYTVDVDPTDRIDKVSRFFEPIGDEPLLEVSMGNGDMLDLDIACVLASPYGMKQEVRPFHVDTHGLVIGGTYYGPLDLRGNRKLLSGWTNACA